MGAKLRAEQPPSEESLIAIANLLIDALILLILVSSVMSWFHPDPRNTFVRLVNAVVEPLLHPIRAVMPAVGPFDLSPLVAFAVLMLLQRLLQGAL
ncbi:MAG: YggT family protein [Acidobacteria bacterium]|nr:YggT family protein [Acidobacteriota bacterium]